MTSTRRPKGSELGAAAAVLARAFVDDPVARHAEPDPAHRLPACLEFFSVVARAWTACIEVCFDGAVLAGVVVRIPPEADSAEEDLVARMSLQPDVGRRFGEAMAVLDAVHARQMPGAHWYLPFLGVAPESQGRGLGTLLLDAVHARAAADGLPMFLETFDGPNVAFYGRRGYVVLSRDRSPIGPEAVVAMLRPAARSIEPAR